MNTRIYLYCCLSSYVVWEPVKYSMGNAVLGINGNVMLDSQVSLILHNDGKAFHGDFSPLSNANILL